MNFFVVIGIIVVVRVLKSYIANSTKGKNRYISNEKESDKSLLVNSYKILGLEHDEPISIEIINKAFHKQLTLSTDDRLRGYKPTYSLKELRAAKAYLRDFCIYMEPKN